MNRFFGKLLTLLLALILSLSIASCDFFSRTNSTETTSTTSMEITSSTITTVSQTTTDSTTTIFETTTHEPITTLETTTVTETTTIETTTSFETTTEYVNGARLVITSPSKTVYTVFDTLNLTGLVVTFYDADNNSTVLTAQDYTISNVDMYTYGLKQVDISYGDYTSFFVIEVNLPTYYLNATDKTGNLLLATLRSIINSGFHGVTYGDARYILQDSDEDPNNKDNIILIYSGASIPSTWGDTWNREHVWPKSYLPDTDVENNDISTASDLHNLKPCNPSINSSRGNKWFDNYTTTVSYAPRDEDKGDVARIMLYMVIKYNELTLVDGTPKYLEMGQFSVLLQWHEQDPVDDFERNRNEVIYSYQGNRNPFIDYPDFAELIWN